MLIKLINAAVSDRKRFEAEQLRWSALAETPGFLVQIGGWANGPYDRAVIVSAWTDRSAYETFMEREHDAIAGAQEQTYRELSVELFEDVEQIDGAAGGLTQAARAAALLRVAVCDVHDRHVEHFTTVQHEIWNPGMAQSAGMLSGVFARAELDSLRFVVATLWESRAAHSRYQSLRFPVLNARADAAGDLASVEAQLVKLVPEWVVVGRA